MIYIIFAVSQPNTSNGHRGFRELVAKENILI